MSRIYQGGQAKKSYKGSARGANFNPTQVTNQTNAIRRQGKQELDNLNSQDRERRRSEQAASTSRQLQNQLDRTQQRIVQQEVSNQLNLEQAIDKNILAASQTYKKGELVLDQLVERSNQKLQFSTDKNKLGFSQMLERDSLKLQDMQEKTQLGLDSRVVAADNAISLATLSARQSVDNANRAVGQAIIQGLVDFATTGISVVAKENKRKADEAELESLALDWIDSSEGSALSAAPDIQENRDIQRSEVAFEAGVQRVSPDSAIGRENIRKPYADVTMRRNLEQRSINVAALTFGGDLAAALSDPNTKVMINGDSRSINTLSGPEYANAVLQVARQIHREYGINLNSNSHAVKMSYGRAAKQAISNQTLQGVAAAQTRDQSQRAFAARDNAASYMANGQPQTAWDTIFNGYRASGKYDNMGDAELTEVALKDLLAATPGELRGTLYNVVKDSKSNTTFGDKGNYKLGDMIYDSINKDFQEKFQADKVKSESNRFDAKKVFQTFQTELQFANDGDASQQLRQDAIAQLRTMGPEAIDFITRVENGGRMRATPAVFNRLMQEIDEGGSQTMQERLDYYSDGELTKEQFETLNSRAKTLDSIEQIKTESGIGNGKSDIESIVASAAVRNATKEMTMTDARLATSGISAVIHKRYERDMNNFIRLQGDKVDPQDVIKESARLMNEIRRELNGPEGSKNKGEIVVSGQDVTYKGWDEQPAAKVRINPTNGRDQAVYDLHDVSAVPPTADITNDILYTRKEYLEQVEILQYGGQGYSPRTLGLAALLSTTPQKLLESQAEAFGYGRDVLGQVSFDIMNAAEQPNTPQAGERSLMAMGFTAQGASSIANNIQWDQSGSPTSGVIKFTPDRLAKFQEFFAGPNGSGGIPFDKSTTAEKLFVMKNDMRLNYPASYGILTNPSSGPAQIKRAITDYFADDATAERLRKSRSLITGESVSFSTSGQRTGTGTAPSTHTDALIEVAATLGVNPIDLATIIGFESAGTYDPGKVGGEGGNYQGLIQFGISERKAYGVVPGMTFEEQLRGPVLRYFQDRFRAAGWETQGATLEDLYTTVIAGNPGANRDARDSFGTSARSGVAKMGGHRAQAMKRFGLTQ